MQHNRSFNCHYNMIYCVCQEKGQDKQKKYERGFQMENKKEQEVIKEAQRAYKKAWRAKNRDKVKKSNDRYWLKKAAEMGIAKSGENGGQNG